MSKKRLTKLFEFLKAYTDLRYPPVLDLLQQPKHLWLNDLPDHSTIVLYRDAENNGESGEDDNVVLVVSRPELTPCPAPNTEFSDWLKPGWQDVNGRVEINLTRTVTGQNGRAVAERFDANARRVEYYRRWQTERTRWLEKELPARNAMQVFKTIYEWHGIQGREEEEIEILVGDGLLQFDEGVHNLNHPVLLQKVELEFHPEKKRPTFIFRLREQPPELYTEFLRSIPAVDSQQLACCIQELKEAEFAPLGEGDTEGFLRRLIIGLFPGGGQFKESGKEATQETSPTITRAPALFMRKRRVNVFDKVLEDIAIREEFPASLLKILDVEIPVQNSAGAKDKESGPTPIISEEDILFSKPTNHEQFEIAKRLSRHDCVLVQGPPGTGKTHSIANLLGHLLAQGKKVLVTAHTPKALRVLREKVVEPLRPLCISVLQRDKQSQEDLQDSVKKIHFRLGDDVVQLEKDAERLRKERNKLITEKRDLRRQLLEARQDEIRDIVYAGKSVRPIDAAKQVKTGKGVNDWIPEPVTLGAPLPLSPAELTELYQTNARVSLNVERELNAWRPDMSKLPSPADFTMTVRELKTLREKDLKLRNELWTANCEPADLAEFDRMLELAKKTIETLRESTPWQIEAIQAGRDGAQARAAWDSLTKLIESTWGEIQQCNALVMEYGPAIDDERPKNELLEMVEEIIRHHENGNSFGILTKFTRRPWFEFVQRVRIGSRTCALENIAHMRAVRSLLRMQCLRTELRERWERNIACKGGLSCADLGEYPEQVCHQFIPKIQGCLEWHSKIWVPLEKEFERLGFKWKAYLEAIHPEPGDHSGLKRIRKAIVGELEAILEARCGYLHHNRLMIRLKKWYEMTAAPGNGAVAQTAQRIRQAIKEDVPDNYRSAHDLLSVLRRLEPELSNRQELLKKLERSAPAWASAIENRVAQHGQPQLPGDARAAWEWRQLHDELERRASVSLEKIQQRLEALGPQLLETTAQLVEKQTWKHQILNTDESHKRALGAYAALRNMIRKSGKGVRDPQVRKEARKQMAAAKDSVPVWIMPLAEVAETFDPKTTRFDVVIVDEASQCDPTALFALYLGRQTIIVGDDEQVTPVATGVDMTEVTKLINVYLNGVSYKELYDGTNSIYGLAQVAFGGVIRLTEHFRCAPDIIAFSNSLSYKGEIKPLREAAAVPLTPHVVHYRLQCRGTDRDENVNEDEATVVASLICAMIEQSEYAKNELGGATTIGVVSLVGERQALVIDSILREHLEPIEYQQRQILCGDAAHFQGDERDVMFLSVVDCPPEQPPLPMRQEGPKGIFKKRFNVAASRARNQMWVVHSLNHETDLKPGDYRRRLIEHALEPGKWESELRNRLNQIDPRSKMFEGPVLAANRN